MSKEKKDYTEEMSLVRANLKSLTTTLRLSAALGQIADCGPESRANDLLRSYYAMKGHTELKTIKQWREDGMQVKKGSKALYVWSKPKSYTTKIKTSGTTNEVELTLNEEGQSQEESAQSSGETYYYVALFSNLMVEPVKQREPKQKKQSKKNYNLFTDFA